MDEVSAGSAASDSPDYAVLEKTKSVLRNNDPRKIPGLDRRKF